MQKSHASAVVLIPPKNLWEPIQGIRKIHDKGFRRWMPHISLLYPFAPKSSFSKVLPELAQVGWEQDPFELTLAHVRFFRHGRESYTLWLEPEPAGPLHALHASLLKALPKFADKGSFKGGFSPHLTVGQLEGRGQLEPLITELQKNWKPLRFTVHELALISRKDPPNDIFQIDQTLTLGS